MFEIDSDIFSNYEKLAILSKKVASMTSVKLIEMNRKSWYGKKQ